MFKKFFIGLLLMVGLVACMPIEPGPAITDFSVVEHDNGTVDVDWEVAPHRPNIITWSMAIDEDSGRTLQSRSLEVACAEECAAAQSFSDTFTGTPHDSGHYYIQVVAGYVDENDVRRPLAKSRTHRVFLNTWE